MKTVLSKPGWSTSGTEPIRPLHARHKGGRIVIECSDGQTVEFEAARNPVLRNASPEQLDHIECSAFGLHWPDLDEDLSLQGIIEGRFGQKGGARPGAGRKPSGRVQYVTRLKPDLLLWIKIEAERKGEDECAFIEGILEKEKQKATTKRIKVFPGQSKVTIGDTATGRLIRRRVVGSTTASDKGITRKVTST